MAHRSLGRNRLREWRILLVSDETLSSGRSRLPLGTAPRTSFTRPAESLRYAAGTVSTDRRIVRASIRPLAAGAGCRPFLGNQFFSSRLRSHEAWLFPPADFLRLSVLGWNPHRAVVTDYCGQRVLSALASRNDGKTTDRAAGLFNAPKPSRTLGLCGRGGV